MKRLVFRRADGGITISSSGLGPGKLEALMLKKVSQGMTREAAESEHLSVLKAEVLKKHVKLAGSTFLGEVEYKDLPSREFRNQWRENNGKVRVDPVLETEARWTKIRAQRDKLLRESDWEVVRDGERGNSNQSLKTYREALRDVTTQPDPKNINWPEKP